MRFDDAIPLALTLLDVETADGGSVFMHSMRVALRLREWGEPEYVQVAGLLHDLVEDTSMTMAMLRTVPFFHSPEGYRALAIIEAMTRRDGESYDEYVNRLAVTPGAPTVKRADMLDNTDIRRYAPEKASLSKRYMKTYHTLRGLK